MLRARNMGSTTQTARANWVVLPISTDEQIRHDAAELLNGWRYSHVVLVCSLGFSA